MISGYENKGLKSPNNCAIVELVQDSDSGILKRWLLRRRQTLLMELAEIEDALELPRTKPARQR